MSDPGDLIAAMLAQHEHQWLYTHSASFKMSVNVLAQMIPAMLNGLALEAAAEDRRREEMMRVLMYDPQPPVKINIDEEGRMSLQ